MLGHRDELVGHDEPALRMVPAHEGLDADDGTGAQRDLGLVVHLQLAVGQRVAQPTEQSEPAGRVAVAVGHVELDAGALLLGEVHGDVGPTHDRVDVLTVLGEHRDPDARLELEEHSLDVEGPGESLPDAVRHLDCRVGAAHRVEQDGVLVPTEPGHDVVGSQRPLDPLGDDGQQPVTDLVAQCVVDLLEPVEVEQAESDVHLLATCLVEPGGQLAEDHLAVRQPGERVVQRLMLLLAGDGRGLANGVQRQQEQRQEGRLLRDEHDDR